MPTDYYKILCVPRTATSEQIKASYRIKAKQYHPDINKLHNASEQFQVIGLAYQTLINPGKRKQYDLKLKYGTRLRQPYHSRNYSNRYGSKYSNSSGTDHHYNYFRSKKKVKEDKKTIYFNNTLFSLMVVIGICALIYSIIDILSGNEIIFMEGIQGLAFSLIYLFLLIYGWILLKKYRK